MSRLLVDPFANKNFPGYSTRMSPTAIVLCITVSGDIFVSLVTNAGPGGKRLFPNGKREETDGPLHDNNSIISGAIREWEEETGGVQGSSLMHIASLGDLYRKSGTTAIHDNEQAYLDSIVDTNNKFLFVKKQLYELFLLQVANSITQPPFFGEKDHDILAAEWIKIYDGQTQKAVKDIIDYIEIPTDKLITELLLTHLQNKDFISALISLDKKKIMELLSKPVYKNNGKDQNIFQYIKTFSEKLF
ncbi:MAG: NUDIX hydrolase [Candidatus Absconditabacterales bacterium]|nr:NUDIX hydrolase [Candidatus Absconditabacterales bacterium]